MNRKTSGDKSLGITTRKVNLETAQSFYRATGSKVSSSGAVTF
jgi:hypothetical protein